MNKTTRHIGTRTVSPAEFNTIQEYAFGRGRLKTIPQIAAKFGRSQATVYRILRADSWQGYLDMKESVREALYKSKGDYEPVAERQQGSSSSEGAAMAVEGMVEAIEAAESLMNTLHATIGSAKELVATLHQVQIKEEKRTRGIFSFVRGKGKK